MGIMPTFGFIGGNLSGLAKRDSGLKAQACMQAHKIASPLDAFWHVDSKC